MDHYSELFNAHVLVMILAGGEGTRLSPLTNHRAKPAVPFGGHYRIIDFVLSNFVNSGFFHIKVLIQYKSDSLNKHISRGWRLSAMLGNYIEVVPPQMRTGSKEWFKGSADAIYQNLNIITDEKPKYVCVFGADHIYKLDVRQMLAYHIEKKAECTVASIPVPIKQASSFGCVQIDENWRITGWQEKPKAPNPIPGRPDYALASMGNYIFNIDTLVDAIRTDSQKSSSHDFGKDIIPSLLGNSGLFAYDFYSNEVPGQSDLERGYWRDVGDIDTYWASNMDLVSVSPIMDIHNRSWPILSHSMPAPPAKFVFADEETKRIGIATDSLVCEGAIISGGRIDRCIISPFVRINSFAHVEESILMDNVDVGRYAKIRRAIIDKNVKVPAGMVIGYDHKEDAKRFQISKGGIVVIEKGAKLD